jgi:hypothetical protein
MPESRKQNPHSAQYLTGDITRSLKFSTQVTPLQQQAAKERLLRLAASQMPLEPVPDAPTRRLPLSLREHAAALRPHVANLMHFLFDDSDIYERARRLPPHYRHYNVHGHYAYTIIQISA